MRLTIYLGFVMASLLYPAADSYSALSLNKLEIEHLEPEEDLWNAAAVYTLSHGWVVMATLTQCWWGTCGAWERADARPWIAQLGAEHAPDLSRFRDGAKFEYDLDSFAHLSTINKTSQMLNQDFRPFQWDGDLFVSFSHRRHEFYPEYEAIARVDTVQQQLILRQVFEEYGNQKNWGFFQDADSRRLVLYSTLPCTRILEHDRATGALTPVFNACYADVDDALKEATLLSIGDAHNSGHPVPWVKTPGEPADEYLLMVHVRDTYKVGGYNHWLLRMDVKTHALTHVSHGIVFGKALSPADGKYPVAVIVGSFNLVTLSSRQFLSVFGGQGDTYCVHDHIDLRRVKWLDVAGMLHAEVLPPGLVDAL